MAQMAADSTAAASNPPNQEQIRTAVQNAIQARAKYEKARANYDRVNHLTHCYNAPRTGLAIIAMARHNMVLAMQLLPTASKERAAVQSMLDREFKWFDDQVAARGG